MGKQFNAAIDNRISRKVDRDQKKKAKSLVPKLIIHNLPDFFECREQTSIYHETPSDKLTYGAILAHTRHTYTNYDALCQTLQEAYIFNDATVADYRRKYDRKIIALWEDYKQQRNQLTFSK
jgi:hypothetical protein